MPWPTVRLPKIPVVVLRVFVLNCASAVQCQATTAANQSATVGMEMRMTGPPKKENTLRPSYTQWAVYPTRRGHPPGLRRLRRSPRPPGGHHPRLFRQPSATPPI